MTADEVITRTAELCRKYRAREVILFGSRAKGTALERSDIDIAVSGVEKFDALLEERLASERWVKVNQNTLCLVQYPEAMQKRLEDAVRAKELGALDRIQLVLDLKRLCNAQRVKPAHVLNFLRCYQAEDDWSVLEVVCSLLAHVSTFPRFEG